jgi:hypothetical protein
MDRLNMDDDHLSDIQVIAGDRTFQCHKLILASRSDVFEAMFSHGNSKECIEGKIFLSEDPEVIQMFLEFLYSDKVKNDFVSDNATKLLLMADKYNVPNLKHICSQYLFTHVVVENCADILIAARFSNLKALEKISFKFIAKNMAIIKQTEQWQAMARSHPELTLLENFED